MDLSGIRVAVLGGTSGIGLATARAAATAGAEVVVVSARPESVERALSGLPAGTGGFAVDLADPAGVGDVFDRIGALDHLIYTAGDPLELAELDTLDLDRGRKAFEVRYFGVLASVQAARPHLRSGGSITLTTGIAGRRPQPNWSVAASICGAVESLTRALAVELAPIRVNAVSPGLVRSPLWGGIDPVDREALYRATADLLPAGRIGEVDDIAQAYLYLLCQPFSTGTILTLDGGGVLV